MFQLKKTKKELNIKDVENEILKQNKDHSGIVRVFRVFVYLLLALIMIRGVTSIFKNDRAEVNELKLEIDDFIKHPGKYVNSNQPISIAIVYLTEYLEGKPTTSFSVNSAERKNKVEQLRVADTVVYDVVKQDTSTLVTIAAIIEAKDPNKDNILVTSIMFFKVIVEQVDGKYVVFREPLRIAAPEKATYESRDLGSSLSQSDPIWIAVENDLVSFFKAFYEGSSNDISYLAVTDIRGLEGVAKFVGVEKLSVYKTSDDEVLALVTVNTEDEILGLLPQYCELRLKKIDTKWKVESIDIQQELEIPKEENENDK